MNTSSVMRVIGSPLLIATFLIAPVSPALTQVTAKNILPVSIAEAAAISFGSISGVVNLKTSLVTNLVAPEVVVNLYLNESNALVGSTVTNKDGAFSFSGVQGLTYKVEVSPKVGFGFSSKASSTQIITLNRNNETLDSFVVEKLPAVKVFGPAIVNVFVGDKFEDPGVAFVKDDGTVVSGFGIDGNGTVDTKTPGTYILTYHVDSSATNGYPTIDATRTVNVLPKIIAITPVIANKSGLTVLPNANTKIYLNSYLGKSYSNDKFEVLKLQAFLFFKEGYTNVKATGIYDAPTELAVRNFQDRYYREILMPWGTEDNTGEVRMMTLRKINDLYNGVNTPITIGQEFTLESSRKQDEINRNPVIAEVSAPITLPVVEKTSITNKITSWWNNAKRSLIAAFPAFKNDDKDKASISTTTALATVEKSDNMSNEKVASDDNLAAAKSTKSNNVSNALIFLASVFALLAFVVAAYIYKKTRGPVLITVEEEVEEAINGPTKK